MSRSLRQKPPLESTIVAAIVRALRSRGALVLKTHGGAYQQPGWPDLLVCYRGRFIGLEVKRPGEAPTKLQSHRLAAIAAAGGGAAVATSVAEAIAVLDRIPEEPAP